MCNAFPLIVTFMILFITKSISKGKDFDERAFLCIKQYSHVAFGTTSCNLMISNPMSYHSFGTIYEYSNAFHQSLLYFP